MLIAAVPGATRVLGKEQGYRSLPVREDVTTLELRGSSYVVPTITTAWTPTEDELARLAAGAAVYVTIIARSHPPITVAVGAAPGDDVMEVAPDAG